MTAEGNGRRRTYLISISGSVSKVIKAEGRRARKVGRFTQFIDALHVVERRLRDDPLGFGEQTGGTIGVSLVYHTGSVWPISVRFAIDQAHAVVYLQEVILSSTGLWSHQCSTHPSPAARSSPPQPLPR
jgi:hypothetical protein